MPTLHILYRRNVQFAQFNGETVEFGLDVEIPPEDLPKYQTAAYQYYRGLRAVGEKVLSEDQREFETKGVKQ